MAEDIKMNIIILEKSHVAAHLRKDSNTGRVVAVAGYNNSKVKKEGLSKQQANVLDALKSLPKKYRHYDKVGGPIRFEFIDTYDGRSINALVKKALLNSAIMVSKF